VRNDDDELERSETILERVEVAADQVLVAAKTGDPTKVKSVLLYWFGVLYDEGRRRVAQAEQKALSLKELNEKLRAMNEQLRRRLKSPREE